MRFRPRYSLLTLLIFTALVAGGVKFWYVPQHVVMSDPPTLDEIALLERLDSREAMDSYKLPIVHEYAYQYKGIKRKYLLVKGSLAENLVIPIYSTGQNEVPYLELELPVPPQKYADAITTSREELAVCWLYNPTVINEPPEPPASSCGTGYGYQTPCFVLSSRKKIYLIELTAAPMLILLKQIELSQLDDPGFRECVARELAKIPNTP